MAIDPYHKHYVELRFERAGLFELMQHTYGCSQVLYPGCFVHITPSFYFPHAVYVDRHPEAQSFFADLESILQFVERNKHYKRSAYIRFIAQDFTDPLPLPNASFDLLISIFAGEVVHSCMRYLKTEGLLLTDNPLKDVRDDVTDAAIKLIAVVRYQRGKYNLIEGLSGRLAISNKVSTRPLRYLRQGDRGVQYVENEIYYIFRKQRPQDP